MKKKISSILSLVLVGSSSLVGASALESHGDIGFHPGSDITLPVSPINPDPNKPNIPQLPDGSIPNPGTKGPLSIDFVSDFDFGTHPISNKDQEYFGKAQTYFDSEIVTPNYIQVTDNRGNLNGWSLRVVQDRQFNHMQIGKHPEINGASVSINDSIAVSNSNSDSPKSYEIESLIPGVERLVAQARSGTGAGTWVIRWGEIDDLVQQNNTIVSPSIKLFVPGNSGKDAVAYSTTFTWSIASLPSIENKK